MVDFILFVLIIALAFYAVDTKNKLRKIAEIYDDLFNRVDATFADNNQRIQQLEHNKKHKKL